MGETEEFNALAFEKKLAALKDTQESIQGLSSWCLKQREHHKKIVQSWLNVLKRVKVEQRLVLFYLANDVIQYSKRKNYEFVESWGLNLQKATPLVREEKVRKKILRIFKIWEQRQVYDEEFLSDLTGLLSAGAVKKTDDDALDFQPQQLVNKIKQCSVLESDTDLRLKHIHECPLQLSDMDALSTNLKDRSNKDDVEKELNEGIAVVERYTAALQREIVAREALLALLTSASQYYSTQRGEVKVVAYAYKNFGSRVRQLKRKLDELVPKLPGAVPSPPQRDEDVPSPGPDEDLDLPILDGGDDVSYNIDKTFNTSLTADGSLYNLGLSSFLDGDAMALFHDNNSQGHDTVAGVTLSQKSQDALPGLDLLTPDSTGAPPPTSFYGSALDNDESDQQYRPEPINNHRQQWSTSNNTQPTWSLSSTVPPPPVPPVLSVSPQPYTPTTYAPPPVPPVLSTALMHSAPPASPPQIDKIYTSTSYAPPPAPPVLSTALMHSAPPASPPHVEQIYASTSFPPPLAPAVRPPAVMHSAPPASPPHAHPLYTPDMSSGDVDHRGLLPPPPPPPVIPTLSVLAQLEDVDHRLLPTLPPPPPPVTTANRHANNIKDVDHRNLISLTHQPPTQTPQRPVSRGLDQDYRVPPPMGPPPDIVESVDMDLSEDEDQAQPGMYENNRRNSSNQNNKVLVGGDNGKTNHNNLIRINSMPSGEQRYQDTLDAPATAPIVPPLSNPFDKMPSGLQFNNMNQQFGFREDPRRSEANEQPFRFREDPRKQEQEDGNSVENEYDEDLRSRGIDVCSNRDLSPPIDFEEFEGDWPNAGPNVGPRFMNQRFPRNWNPRANFRPQGFGPTPQFWPRNSPRPPRPYGQRPGRFW